MAIKTSAARDALKNQPQATAINASNTAQLNTYITVTMRKPKLSGK